MPRPTDAEYRDAAYAIARKRYAADHAAWVAAGRKSAWQQAFEDEARRAAEAQNDGDEHAVLGDAMTVPFAHHIAGTVIARDGAALPMSEVRDLRLILATEARDLLAYGRLETARRLYLDLIDLDAAYQAAKRWGLCSAPTREHWSEL